MTLPAVVGPRAFGAYVVHGVRCRAGVEPPDQKAADLVAVLPPMPLPGRDTGHRAGRMD